MQSDQTHLLNNLHQIAAVNDLFVTDMSPLWSQDAKYIKGRGICVPILSRLGDLVSVINFRTGLRDRAPDEIEY